MIMVSGRFQLGGETIDPDEYMDASDEQFLKAAGRSVNSNWKAREGE